MKNKGYCAFALIICLFVTAAAQRTVLTYDENGRIIQGNYTYPTVLNQDWRFRPLNQTRGNMTEVTVTTLPGRSGFTETTTTLGGVTTTIVKRGICGGTDLYCSVDYDSNGDGRPDCCAAENNPTCARCLKYCKDKCASQYLGLETCFISDRNETNCQCSKTIPECYKLLDVLPSTTMKKEAAGGDTMPLAYILALGAILASLAYAVHFVYKAG